MGGGRELGLGLSTALVREVSGWEREESDLNDVGPKTNSSV